MEATGSRSYTRPYLYPKQHDALFCPERFATVEASTKSGKTVGSMAWLLEEAFQGKPGWNYWWVAPVSSQADIAFTRFKNGLTRGSFTPRERYGQPTLTLANQCIIWFKSADNPDSLYGEDVYGAVQDEASRQKEEARNAVRSTLTATRGRCRYIGNVKGRKNWFYQLCRYAQDVMREEPDPAKRDYHYAKITAYDAVEAGVLDAAEIEDARKTLPEIVFRELYLAEPADDGGNPFGLQHIEACKVEGLSSKPPVAYGIDLAKKQDFLVVIGLDEDGAVCRFHRWQGIPWRASITRIHEIVGEDVPALVDSTGIGDPVLEELQVGHGNFVGYAFTAASKQKLMEGLAVSIQGHEIHYPSGRIASELEAFEYIYTRTGVRYGVSDDAQDSHDDAVCALALAREQWTTVAPGANLMQYYATTAQEAERKKVGAKPDAALPWHQTDILSRHEILDNELTELYNLTLKGYEPKQHVCKACGEVVGGNSRISDGEFVWHVYCTKAPAL